MINPFENISKKNINKLLDSLYADVINVEKNSAVSKSIIDNNSIGIIVEGYLQILRTNYNGNTIIIDELVENNVFGSSLSYVPSKDAVSSVIVSDSLDTFPSLHLLSATLSESLLQLSILFTSTESSAYAAAGANIIRKNAISNPFKLKIFLFFIPKPPFKNGNLKIALYTSTTYLIFQYFFHYYYNFQYLEKYSDYLFT